MNSEFDLPLTVAKRAIVASTAEDRIAALAHMPPVSDRRRSAGALLQELELTDVMLGGDTPTICLAAEALRALVAHHHATPTSVHPVDITVLPFTESWQSGSVHPSLGVPVRELCQQQGKRYAATEACAGALAAEPVQRSGTSSRTAPSPTGSHPR